MERISQELCVCTGMCIRVCQLHWGSNARACSWSQGQLPGTAPAELQLAWTHRMDPRADLVLPRQRGAEEVVLGLWVSGACWTWNHRAAQLCLPQAAGSSRIHLPSNKYHHHQIIVHPHLSDWTEWMGGKRKSKNKTTHLCIIFPGASFTRPPFSIGLPSFADGLFVSERVKK